MNRSWEDVHVFISSTFNDMHAERDLLVKDVFPRLRSWCEERHLRLIDVDLRWGVTEEEATKNRDTVRVCLERIDQCRPFFICFSGHRYGWIPSGEDIGRQTLEDFPALKHAVERGCSLTELEVIHATQSLRVGDAHQKGSSPGPLSGSVSDEVESLAFPGGELPSRSFFFLREPGALAGIPDDPLGLPRIYDDRWEPDLSLRKSLLEAQRRFREETIPASGHPIRRYTAQWYPDQSTPENAIPLSCTSHLPEVQEAWREVWTTSVGISPKGLEIQLDSKEGEVAREFNRRLTGGRLGGFLSEGRPLGDAVFSDLTGAIKAEFPERTMPSRPESRVALEKAQQSLFLGTLETSPVGRENELRSLDDYVKNDCRRVLVVTGETGFGKSTLLGAWIHSWTQNHAGEAGSLHYRFVGSSDGSQNPHDLLRLLLLEITEGFEAFDRPIPSDAIELRAVWLSLLERASRERRVIVIFDALDQLEEGLEDLDWLPAELPERVKLIVSFDVSGPTEREKLGWIKRRSEIDHLEVGPVSSESDRRAIVDGFLGRFLKKLDQHHTKALVGLPGSANPLFLKVALSEMRVFGAFATLGEKIRNQLGESPRSAFDRVLARLEREPLAALPDPSGVVPFLFGLLASARRGLSVDELRGALRLHFRGDLADEGKIGEVVELVLRQVISFMARRDGRYSFRYDSFREAVRQRYVTERVSAENRGANHSPERVFHRLLSDYLARATSTDEGVGEREPREAVPQGKRVRRVSELPYHLTGAKDWEGLVECLTDTTFLEEKVRAGFRSDLEQDYRAADRRLEAEGEEDRLQRLSEFERFLHTKAPFLDEFRELEGFFAQEAHNLGSGPVGEAGEKVLAQNPGVLLLRKEVPGIEVESPALLRRFGLGLRSLDAVALSGDGEVCVTCGSTFRSEVHLLDLSKGRHRRSFSGHSGEITAVALTSDGQVCLSAGAEGSLRVWDLEHGRCLQILHSSRTPASVVAISKDGRTGVTASQGGWIDVWDLLHGNHRSTFGFGGSEVLDLSLSSDGSVVLTAHDDDSVISWAVDTGELLCQFRNPLVTCVSLSPDGKRGVAAGGPQVQLLEIPSGRSETFPFLRGRATAVRLSEDGSFALFAAGKNLDLLSMENGNIVRSILTMSPIKDLALSSDRRMAVTAFGETDPHLSVWDLERGRVEPIDEDQSAHAVAVSLDGRTVLTGGGPGDRKLRLWDPSAVECTKEIEVGSVGSLSVTPDAGTVLYSNSSHIISPLPPSEGLMVLQFEAKLERRVLQGHTGSVFATALSHDGKRGASGSLDGTVRIWDLEDGACRHILLGKSGAYNSVALDADGRVLLAGGDEDLLLWDASTGRLLQDLKGFSGAVRGVDMTADGRFGASVADDAVIRFWDLTRGEALESIQCPEGHSGPIAFIGDAFLCSSGDDHAIRVWNVKTGVLLGAAVFLPYVTSLGAGETHIVVGSYDGLGLFRVAGLPEGGKSRFQSPEVAFSPEREAGWGVDYAGIKEVAMETMAAFLRREPPRAAECETVGKWFHSEGVLKEGVRLSLRGGEYFYEVWKAVDRGRAMAFLRGIPRACIPELYYIVVEYPGGSLGLDVSGIFDEATGTTIE